MMASSDESTMEARRKDSRERCSARWKSRALSIAMAACAAMPMARRSADSVKTARLGMPEEKTTENFTRAGFHGDCKIAADR